jgi:hypothetical protein
MTYCKLAIVGFLPRQQLSLSIQFKNSAKMVQAILLTKALFEKRIIPTKEQGGIISGRSQDWAGSP